MSRLAELAAAHNAARAQTAARAAARRPARAGSTPATATDPERCRAPGRTLARPAWWPEESAAWHGDDDTPPPPAADHRPSRGKRSGGWCPDCREQRSRTGVCWCGSDARATTRTGTPIGGGRTHRSRALPPEAQGPAWALVHRRMHPTPQTDCARCAVAHEPA